MKIIETYVRYINTDCNNLDRFMIIDQFYYLVNVDKFNLYEAFNDNDLYELTQACYFINKNSESRGEFNISSYQEFIGIQDVFSKFSNLFESFDIKWNGISSGQYSMLTLFSRINFEFNSNNDVIIIIDEGEINLHPEWQRTYISDLIDFILSIKEEHQQVKLILTSHSPFVLSDLPMPSINIVGSDIEDSTSLFGANIYDIYNKGFMLEKTVGQFSYGKIEEIIENIKINGHNPETDKLISLIGDKFIQDILSNLDSD
nr:AAA family ATPase [Photobacterium phosphoreum]